MEMSRAEMHEMGFMVYKGRSFERVWILLFQLGSNCTVAILPLLLLHVFSLLYYQSLAAIRRLRSVTY